MLLDKINNQANLKQNSSSSDVSNLNVTFRVGDCNISKNDWESNSIKVSQSNLQKPLQKIGFGEVVIIIPSSLQEKML